ncbi:TonB-dependent receptor [Porphyromonas levii]|uniref:TonB-dependent receptor n=2 Tax=Porphyromonas levii TaxID=28114 RepID=A0A4Y8WPF7_9PORP|nr:TonB-dependent receptor [Porphyromonas levii]TFH94692.1 hypothetical protein E4P48_09850 [Porphyromonas levii]TFH95470.1 hypothetical protein E4P47_04460 [Porphyromonas levii]
MRQHSAFALIMGALSFLATPQKGFADQQPVSVLSSDTDSISGNTYKLNTLVITGNRRPKMSKLDVALKDIPVTISNIRLEPLKLRGIFNFQEATRFAPSVNTRTTYGAFQQVSVRGFDYSPIEVDGMRDERTTWNSFPLPDLSMVESIEVVKGPSSVLGGHSSVGGSINIVRKAAKNEPLLELLLATGSWNTHQIAGTIGGKVTEGINTLFNVNREWGDRWRHTGDRRFSLYNNTTFQLAAKHILDLRLSYVHDFYGTEAGLPRTMPGDITYEPTGKEIYKKGDMLRGLNPTWRYNNPTDFMWNKGWNAYLRYNWYIAEGWKLSNKMMYSHDIIDYFSSESLSYPTSDEPIYQYSYTSKGKKKYIDLDHIVLDFPLRFQHVAKTFQNHIDLNGRFNLGSIKNKFMVGASYTFLDRHSFQGYNVSDKPYSPNTFGDHDVYGPGVNTPINVYDPQSAGPIYQRLSTAAKFHTQVIGVFMQDMLKFTETLKAFVALRYNNYSIRHFKGLEVVDRKPEYKGGEVADNLTYNALTYRFGLVYEPIKDVTLYGSYANFFLPDRRSRTPNPKVIYINKEGKIIDQQTADFSKSIFDPTTGYQAELGTSFTINENFEGRLSGYHILQKNLVRTIGYVPGTDEKGKEIQKSVTAQCGSVLSSGVEAEVTYSPLHNLSLSAGYGYNHSRYGEVAQNELGLKGADKGNLLNHIPQHTFFSYGSYTFVKGVLSGLNLNYSTTYTGKMYRDFGSNLSFDPYFLLNLGARYTVADTGLSIGLMMNNVLDKRYYAQALGTQLIPAEPRSVKLILNYKIW